MASAFELAHLQTGGHRAALQNHPEEAGNANQHRQVLGAKWVLVSADGSFSFFLN